MTTQQAELHNMIEGIMCNVYSKKLRIHKIEDLLKMIVESDNVEQSIKDFVNAEDIEYENDN